VGTAREPARQFHNSACSEHDTQWLNPNNGIKGISEIHPHPSRPPPAPEREPSSGVCGSELEQLSAGGSLAVPLDPPGVLMCKGKQPPRGDGSAYHTLASKHRPLTTQSHTMAIVTRPSSDTGGRVGSDTNNRNCNKRPRTARLSPAVGRPRCRRRRRNLRDA
jgi:hypothetical protein